MKTNNEVNKAMAKLANEIQSSLRSYVEPVSERSIAALTDELLEFIPKHSNFDVEVFPNPQLQKIDFFLTPKKEIPPINITFKI